MLMRVFVIVVCMFVIVVVRTLVFVRMRMCHFERRMN
jgi:hypothetical protein